MALVIVLAMACMGAAGVWVRSHWRVDRFYVDREEHKTGFEKRQWHWMVESCRGVVTLSREERPGPRSDIPWETISAADRPRYVAEGERWAGFRFDTEVAQFQRPPGNPFLGPGRMPSRSRWWLVEAPWWAFVALPGICCAMALVPLMRWRLRLARGLCIHCGYDLRATPERCPECGTVTGAGG